MFVKENSGLPVSAFRYDSFQRASTFEGNHRTTACLSFNYYDTEILDTGIDQCLTVTVEFRKFIWADAPCKFNIAARQMFQSAAFRTITDHHEMAFREAYTGPAMIEVGLYDSATLERVVAATGETFVILPSPLNVEGQW